MALKLSNNASSLLASSIAADDVTIAVSSGDEGKFPTLAEGDWHPITVLDADGNLEVMRVTARAGVELTVVRAQEGTTAKEFDAGATVSLRITAGGLLAIGSEAIAAATANASSVVGATVSNALDTLLGAIGSVADSLAALTSQFNLSRFNTGDIKPTFRIAADAGWVMADDGSIGSAASGATNRAHADTLALYTLFWDNLPDEIATVAGGRGVDGAAADFAANKAMTLPRSLGHALGVAGAGAGLISRALGEVAGAETHELTADEIPQLTGTAASAGAHTHLLAKDATSNTRLNTATDPMATDGTTGENDRYILRRTTGIPDVGLSGSGGAHTHTVTVNSGEADGHTNLQPTLFVNIMVKL